MRTDDLITLLAAGATPVDPGAPARRWTLALAASVAVATLMMIALLGVRPTLADNVGVPMFWTKFAFVGWLLAGALIAAWRIGRPGVRLGRVPLAAGAAVLAMWGLAALALLGAAPTERAPLVFGRTYAACPWNIALLSLPIFVAALWAMRGLAPTRLRLAGAAAGLLAGAAGAFVYTFHCPELAAPFLGVWYLLGMAVPTALGALIGPRVLHW